MKELAPFEIEQVAGAGVALADLVRPVGASAIPSDPLAASAYVSALRMQELIKRQTAELMAEVASKF